MAQNRDRSGSSAAAEMLREVISPRYTQAELAERLGVTQQTISSWVQGRTKPSAEAMAKLEDLLEIPMRKWAEPPSSALPAEEPQATGTEGG